MEILLQHNILNRELRLKLDSILVEELNLKREKDSSHSMLGKYSYRGFVHSIKILEDYVKRNLLSDLLFSDDESIIIYYPMLNEDDKLMLKRKKIVS